VASIFSAEKQAKQEFFLKKAVSFSRLHGVISQKIKLFITTAVRTSNTVNFETYLLVRRNVLAGMEIQTLAFWILRTCSLADGWQLSRYVENSSREMKFLRNFGNHLPHCTISKPRGRKPKYIPATKFYESRCSPKLFCRESCGINY
jgi:hypothetical protein